MKNLLFVSVAAGILSGTTISVKAQTSVNSVRFTAPQKKAVQFIEGIEIKREARPADEVDIWAVAIKKPVTVEVKKISPEKATAIESCSPLQFKFAQLMNIDVEAITNTKLYTAIEDWWATRYRYGGTTKKGIDCSAFTNTIITTAFGMVLPRTAKDQYTQSEKIDKENLLEGDLVFFNTRGGVSHVGVYLGNGYFVHSSVHAGVTINSLDDDYYSRKYIGGGRVNVE